jgi:hypothetical protein
VRENNEERLARLRQEMGEQLYEKLVALFRHRYG